MSDNTSSGGIVSEPELALLTELFRRLEGASDPRSLIQREAEAEFNSIVSKIYQERIEPNFQSVTFSLFKSAVRRRCRLRANREDPRFPCV